MHHRDIFLAALDLPATERGVYLDRACADDAELRRLVEELLLSHDEAGSFLEHPAVTDQTRTVGEGVATPEAGAATETGAAPADALSFLAPSPAPGCLGRLGYYDVREMVGRGGMGIVLKAVDTKLQRVVAIKVLSPALAASGTARQRFLREAHAAAAIRDDHVVGIYAVGDEGTVPYLVMEYIAGITLDDRIKQGGSLDVKEVLRIGMQVARGLAAAHAQGLIHRDIKPANILLENGVQRVKLTDFGLARAADDASLTQSGVIAGTPMYMSPEQAEGRPVDPRTDLFSLGSVLYAMCTGRPPFRAESTMAVLKRVCEETPRPIREINPDIPDWLAAIVMKLLAKDPAQRFQSAAEVAELLGQCLAHVQQPDLVARPAPLADTVEAPRRRRRPELRGVARALVRMTPGGMAGTLMLVSLALVVLIVVLIVGGLYGELSRRGGGNQAAPGGGRVEVDQPPRPLTPEELAKLPSPLDGRKRDDILPALLALAGGGDPAQAPLELVAVLGDGRFVLPGEGLTSWMATSPDGKLLAVPRGSNVVLFDAGTGAVVRTLAGRGPRAYGAAFSPDGTRLASGSLGGDGSITVWDVPTGQVVHVLKGHTGDVWRTAFSDDGNGKRLVSGSDDKTAKVWDAEQGVELFTLRGHQAGLRTVAYSPDGRWVLTGSNDGTVKVWDARTGQESKTLRVNSDNVWSLVYSPDGKLLASGGWQGWKLWDAKTFEEVRSGAETAVWLAFTADSRVLLTGRHDNRDGAAHAVTRLDVATGDKIDTLSLKSAGGWAFYALSPDAKTLFAMGGDPPDPFVRSYDAATGKELFPHQGHTEKRVWSVAFSPDGKRLASAGDGGTVLLWDLAGWQPGEPLPPVRNLPGHTETVWSVAFSPDGKLLASVSSDGVIVWNVGDGTTFHTLPGRHQGGSNVAFSPDGKKLAFGWDDGTVWRYDVASGTLGVGLPLHQGVVSAVAFSPDGRVLATKGETDGAVRLTNTATNNVHHIGNTIWSKRHPDFGLAFSPDGKTLAITGEKDVRLYDLEAQTEITLAGHTDWLHGVAFHPAGRLVASSSDDHTVRLWDLSSPGRVLTLGPGPFGHMAREVAFDPTGRYFATSNWNATITIFRTPEPPKPYDPGPPRKLPDPMELAKRPSLADALKRQDIPEEALKQAGGGDATKAPPELVAVLGGKFPRRLAGKEQVAPQGHTGRLITAAVSPDGTLLASAGEDSLVELWDLATGELKQTLRGHAGKVRGVAFSPDGKRLASQGEDGTLRLWDPARGTEAAVLARGKADGWGVAFSPDGKRLASSSQSDGGVYLWDVAGGQLVRVFRGHHAALRLAFSPDGRLLACGGSDATVRVWDVAGGWQVRELRGPGPIASSVGFSPDGRSLAAGSDDGTVKLWDVVTGAEAGSPWKFAGPVEGTAFGPDGRLFAASSWDGTVRLRDLTAQPPRDRTVRLPAGCENLAFTPEGRYLAVPCHDGSVYVLRLAERGKVFEVVDR